MAKMKFSMVTPKVDLWLRERPSKKSVILFGIETHVCVLQTAMDLLQGGWEVTVISDATSSRNSNDRKEAIDQLRTWGASVVSSEAVLLSMLKSADHEKFRQISSLVKEIISEKVHL
jgi:nicotinamidase-related amidase